MAPRTRSSHMNQNRRWPGVPNRYSTRSSSRVMRPKSIATVVVFFIGVASRPSTPSDALVTNASVRSGMISDTAPTNVVLPAPKPPEMTIFVEAASPPLRALVGHAASFLSVRVVRRRWSNRPGWCAPADNPASPGRRSARAPRRAARIRRAAISATDGLSAHNVRIWPRTSFPGQRGGRGSKPTSRSGPPAAD